MEVRFVSFIPVQLKSQRSIDSSEAQQSNPSQQDAAENTRLEVKNPNLQENRRSYKNHGHILNTGGVVVWRKENSFRCNSDTVNSHCRNNDFLLQLNSQIVLAMFLHHWIQVFMINEGNMRYKKLSQQIHNLGIYFICIQSQCPKKGHKCSM